MTSRSLVSPVLNALGDARLPSGLEGEILLEPLSGSSQYVSYLPSLERVDLINRGAYERTRACASAGGLCCWSMRRRERGEGSDGYLVFRVAEARFNIYRSSNVERMDGLAVQALAASGDPKRVYVTVASDRAGTAGFSGACGYEEIIPVSEERAALCVLDSQSPIVEIACEFQPAGDGAKQRYLLVIDADAQTLSVTSERN